MSTEIKKFQSAKNLKIKKLKSLKKRKKETAEIGQRRSCLNCLLELANDLPELTLVKPEQFLHLQRTKSFFPVN